MNIHQFCREMDRERQRRALRPRIEIPGYTMILAIILGGLMWALIVWFFVEIM